MKMGMYDNCDYCDYFINSFGMPRSIEDELWREPGYGVWQDIRRSADIGECRGCAVACDFLSMVMLAIFLDKTKVMSGVGIVYSRPAYELLHLVFLRNGYYRKHGYRNGLFDGMEGK